MFVRVCVCKMCVCDANTQIITVSIHFEVTISNLSKVKKTGFH